MTESKEILAAIEQQLEYLLRTRSLYPYLATAPIGQNRFRTAPFYRAHGFDVEFDFGRPITQGDVDRIRSIGHWINQNFVIRLCALLESYHVIPTKGTGKIDTKLDGHDEVDIVRRLRNEFAHSTGRFNRDDPEERRLYQRVVDHFGVSLAPGIDVAIDYPLSIDVVLEPLTIGCKNYVVAKYGT